jgi:hypothetical protein
MHTISALHHTYSYNSDNIRNSQIENNNKYFWFVIVWNGGVFYLWLYRVGVIHPKLPTPLPKTTRFP